MLLVHMDFNNFGETNLKSKLSLVCQPNIYDIFLCPLLHSSLAHCPLMNGPLFTDIGLSVMDVCLGEGLGLGLSVHRKLLVRGCQTV